MLARCTPPPPSSDPPHQHTTHSTKPNNKTHNKTQNTQIKGDRVNRYVEAEVLNHRMLRHPHVIEFKEVRRALLVFLFVCAPAPAGGARRRSAPSPRWLPFLPLLLPPPPSLSLSLCLSHNKNDLHHTNAKTKPKQQSDESKKVFVTSEYICIAMEYASGGSLFTYVQRAVRLKEAAARWFFQQLVIGLDYCHRRGVVNRDIKVCLG